MKTRTILVLVAMHAAAAVSLAGSGHQIIVIRAAADHQQFEAGLQGVFLLGSEEFAHATVPPGGADIGSAILAPGISVTHFPGGTNPALGITLQTNSLGASPVMLSFGGHLFASSADGAVQIGAGSAGDSLDLIFDPSGYRGLVRAVAFDAFQQGPNEARLRVYSSDLTLLADETVSGLGVEGTRIAVLAPEGETIFRVNLWVPGGSWGDVGGIGVYAIPEPAATAGLLALAALALVVLGRRRR
jgi:hypothetical protein